MFDYLYSVGFFESKKAVEVFIKMVMDYFPCHERKSIEKMVFTKVLSEIVKDKVKYPDVGSVFEYIDKLGLFFDDVDGRVKFMQMSEQMMAEVGGE